MSGTDEGVNTQKTSSEMFELPIRIQNILMNNMMDVINREIAKLVGRPPLIFEKPETDEVN